MRPDKSFLSSDVGQFLGPWPLLEETDVPSTHGLRGENLSYTPGRVQTRLGFGASGQSIGGTFVTGFTNWIFSSASAGPKNYLAYVDDLGFHITETANQSVRILDAYGGFGFAGRYPTFSPGGRRLFLCAYDALGQPDSHGVYIYDSTANNFSSAFLPPFITGALTFNGTKDVATPGATPGDHNFGIIFTTKNGFYGIPSPCSNATGVNVFVPFTYGASTGYKLTITATPILDWSNYSDYSKATLIMSSVTNPSRYWTAPLPSIPLPASGSAPLSWDINFYDSAFTSTRDCMDQFSLLAMLAGTQTPPFLPTVIFPVGNRIGYIVNDAVYGSCVFFSERDNFQALSPDRNLRYLPEQRTVTTGFLLQGTIYLVGPGWTFATTDTGGYPVTWPSMRLIDSQIGTFCPRGVSVNPTGFALIADLNGLQLFTGGQYARRPLSYFQSPVWERINWSQYAKIHLADDKLAKKIYVAAPLDSSTEISHLLTWDYTNGLNEEDVAFSLDNISDPAFVIGALNIIRNDGDSSSPRRRQEVWLAPGLGSTTSYFLRNKLKPTVSFSESNPYLDLSTPVASRYDSPLYPNSSDNTSDLPQMRRHANIQIRVKGSGNLAITSYTLDGQESYVHNQLPLSSTPGKEFNSGFNLINEYVYHSFTNVGLNSWFQISHLIHNYKPTEAFR